MHIRKIIFSLALLALPASTIAAHAEADVPSRPAIEGCTWRQITEMNNGLTSWVQSCDFGDRKIDMSFDNGNLVQTYSDGGDAEPVVQVFKVNEGETAQAAMQRAFGEKTDAATVAKCVIAPFDGNEKLEGGDQFSFVPNADYAAELAKTATADEVPEPPCGEVGVWPDGIQYWQGKDGDGYVMFVTVGQDAPLFDEKTIHFAQLPAASSDSSEIDCCGYKVPKTGIDTDFVLQVCALHPGETSGGDIPYFDCQSYLLAMLDTYKTLEPALPAKDKFCLPKDFETADVVKNLYAEYDYERDAQKRAPEVLLAYLHKTYPCKK
jgi:hypothetical protein